MQKGLSLCVPARLLHKNAVKLSSCTVWDPISLDFCDKDSTFFFYWYIHYIYKYIHMDNDKDSDFNIHI